MPPFQRPATSLTSIPRMLKAATSALQANDLAMAHRLLSVILKNTPQEPQACYLMGMVLLQSDRLEQACLLFKRALMQAPKNVQVMNGLASALQMQGKYDESLKVYEKALTLKPDYGSAYNNCAVIYKKQGDFQQAERCYKKAVECSKDFGDALNNLGFVQQEQGKIHEACESFWQAHTSGKCRANAYSNYLMALNYDAALSSQQLIQAHTSWGSSLAPRAICEDKKVDRGGPLKRIAYLSADFRAHSVAYFIEPIIAAHDREQYEIFCYYNNVKVDEVTQRIKKKSDHWLDCSSFSDEDLARRIVSDNIDILIELSGHTGLNRLKMMAMKPAPLQVSWLGYPAGTGLPQIDYRISDSVADPQWLESRPAPFGTNGVSLRCAAKTDSAQERDRQEESLIRLPGAFLCYQGDVTAPLARDFREGVTFGSFNNLAKINQEVIEVWATLLKRVPSSCLLVKNSQFQCASTKSSFVKRFGELGIDSNRIECLAFVENMHAHLALYQRVDIALDTFPYNGTTTTFEALWMGVPVVTYTGDRHASRVGASILMELGLPDLVGDNITSYLDIAIALANNTEKRQVLHKGLRSQLQESTLCDASGFARKLESALAQAWRTLTA